MIFKYIIKCFYLVTRIFNHANGNGEFRGYYIGCVIEGVYYYGLFVEK